MKCELCGAEWKTEGELGGQRHAERRCPLNGIALYQPQVEAINEAIEQAKKDTRKPEESRPLSRMLIAPCKKLLEASELEPYAGLYDRSISEIRYWLGQMEKKEG